MTSSPHPVDIAARGRKVVPLTPKSIRDTAAALLREPENEERQADALVALGRMPATTPPHNNEAEQLVLRMLVVPTTHLSPPTIIPTAADYYQADHRLIAAAVSLLRHKGDPVDVATVANAMRANGCTESAVAYMRAFVETTPAAPADAHARIVVRLAKQRRLALRFRDRVHELEEPIADLPVWGADLVADVIAETGDDEAAKARAMMPLADRALAVGANGPRLSTGISRLDELTRGGFLVSKRVLVLGPPGACKTGWVLAFGERWVRQGAYVLVYAADEDASSFVIRLAQMHGIPRDDLERGDETARRRAANLMRDFYPTLFLVDQDAEEWTVDDAVAAFRAACPAGATMVVIVDSAQTVRIRDAKGESRREEIDGVVRRLKRLTTDMLLVLTSEVNRGSYRSRNASENGSDLAAGAETRALEFQASVMLNLRSVKGEPDLIDVTIPKNRLGRRSDKVAFRLRWNFDRATVTEEAPPLEDDEDELEERKGAADRQRVIDAVASEPWLNLRRLREITGMDTGRLGPALSQLLGSLVIEERPGARGARHFASKGTPTEASE